MLVVAVETRTVGICGKRVENFSKLASTTASEWAATDDVDLYTCDLRHTDVRRPIGKNET